MTAQPAATVAALAWHVASCAFALLVLAVVAFVACCVVGDRKRQKEQRRAEVEVAHAHARRLAETEAGGYWGDVDEDPCVDPNTHADHGCPRCQAVIDLVRSIVDDGAWDRALTELGGTA